MTSAFEDHFNHCFVVLKDEEHRTEFRRLSVRRNTINITKFKSVVLDWNLGLGCACLMGCHATGFPVLYPWISLLGWGKNGTLLITKTQRSRAGIPSIRKPASREIISASVELCETDVCFLHVQLVGTYV